MGIIVACTEIGPTYSKLARRNIAEERQPRSTFLLPPASGRQQLPLNLDAVWPRAPTGDFGLIVRVAGRRLLSCVQDRRERWRSAEERVPEPPVCLIRPRVVVPCVVGQA